ncbi:hypothetical protein L195_g053943 [Trifolium pratense]|uniref:Retrotransposon Copia-like N-terminal domain-containing protein n=1 Tax=Trifolium pratense TaxID=57577 RepID=A0A2K3KDD7_TRIPR|nr:hypothetical protein L195_g053943 [Trifolium pratense]
MARNANNGMVNPPPVLPQDPSQTPGNIYYIHPSDGPTTVAITPVLSNSNYHAWAGSMRLALGSETEDSKALIMHGRDLSCFLYDARRSQSHGRGYSNGSSSSKKRVCTYCEDPTDNDDTKH